MRPARSGRDMGRPTESKHREALYQRFSSEILRESDNPVSLEAAANRVLGHAEVAQDPELAAMLRSCLDSRRSELRARQAEQESPRPSHAISAWDHVKPQTARGTPTREQLLSAFQRMRQDFDERLLHFELEAARTALERIAGLQQRYPDVVSQAALERARVDLARTEQRFQSLQAEVDELAKTAIEAARGGDHARAALALKRLSSIHAARPRLLPEPRFQKIREQIAASGEALEHREAAKALIARERAVAAEIRKLSEMVHTFHTAVRSLPHDDPRYREAEAEYHQAVRQVRSHDAEWLADLMLELDDLLEDLHDPTGRAGDQVARFLASVRTALTRMRQEISAIGGEQATQAQRH